VIPLIQKAIEFDPFNPLSHKMLIVNLVATKQYSQAHTALQHYLDIFPQDDFMRQMLARAEGKSTP
jgi:cytochrome c-type biogenesis protein CcmH/NrfG